MRRAILVLLFVAFLSISCHAQPQTGIYSHGAFDTNAFDTVNIGNLNVYFTVPVFSKPGRGLPFYYKLAYNSSVWVPASVSGTPIWTPAANWGWMSKTDALTGYWFSFGHVHVCTVNGRKTVYSDYDKWYYHDNLGVVHTFNNVVSTAPSCSGLPAYDVQYANDNSGYQLVTLTNSGHAEVTVIAPSGQIINPPYQFSGQGSNIDANGNVISVNTSGQFTDTTGNVVLTASGSAPSPTTYTYTDTTGASRSVTVNYSSYTVQTAFGCSGISEYAATSQYLISSISYPDGTSYSFTYEPTPGVPSNVTGRLASVTLPQGGTIQYTYSGGSNGVVCSDGGTATLTRRMSSLTPSPTSTYSRTPGTSSTHTEVVDGMSNYAEYDFVNDPTDTNFTPYLMNHKQYQGNTSGPLLISEQSCFNYSTPPANCNGQTLTLPIRSISTTSTLDGTATKRSVLGFNLYGLLTSDEEDDYSSSSPVLSTTYIAYASLGNGIIDHPSKVWTVVPSGSSPVVVNSVNYSYDSNSLTPTSGLPQHNSVSGSRGNLTAVQYDVQASGGTQIMGAQYYYDDAGQLVASQDARLNTTTYGYDATDSFLTSVTYPTTGGVSHSSSSSWDVVRGVKLWDRNLNNNQTTYTYDNMLRLSSVAFPDGGYETHSYSLGAGSPYTSVSTLHASGSYITSTSYLDQYGRLKTIDSTDTPSDDFVDYTYDANGNVHSISNPYRTGDTLAYTTYSYDALGRKTSIIDSDGASQQQAAYSGNSVTVTDEAGKKRQLFGDGLGRIAKVLEPDSSNNLTLETDYLYTQNPATGGGSTWTSYQTIVNQKGGSSSPSDWRTRTFTYDMLGRVSLSQTPEAGTSTYIYATASGLCAGDLTLPCARWDANATSTTYSYDALNRLTGKTYGGSSIGTGTASVSYYYDQSSYNGLTIANSNGSRTGMSDGSGVTAWSSDTMGRVSAVRKTNNGVTKQANYTYNVDGSINTLQDYGGTTFTYTYDTSGRPTSVFDGFSNTYANGAAYNAAGRLTSLNHQLNFGSAVYARSLQYNNRLQPSVISATLNGTTIQSLTYGYGAGGTNNGDILSITNGLNSTRNQTYSYDNVNRLASGRDASHWGETYTYDNWSNLYQTSQMSGLAGNNWSVSASGSNRLSNLAYDSAGEVTQDQFYNSFSFDAEGRILTVGSSAYVYDGAGSRVKKSGGTSRLYWTGINGETLNESDLSGNIESAYVFFNGSRIARRDTPSTVDVRFTNDSCSGCGGTPVGGGDRNVFVNSVSIGSTTVSGSDSSINYSSNGCSSLSGSMVVVPCNGDVLLSTSVQSSSIGFNGWGTADYSIFPHVQLYANGVLAGEFDVTASSQTYTANSIYFYLQDHLGSVRMVANASGEVLDDVDYYSFGTAANNYGIGSSGNHHSFTGYESDATESSTDYAVFRNLSYTMGRFNRPDPYDGSYDLSNPQSLNRYVYVGNAPLTYFDPFGLVKDPKSKQPPKPDPISCWDMVGGCPWEPGDNDGPNPPLYSRGSGGGGEYGDPNNNSDCRGYHYADPIMGGVELSLKAGPEVQVGWVKVGISMYKNLMTGQTGSKGEVGTGLLGFEANNPTPAGGSFNGGGPGNIEWSANFLGFVKNFTTGSFEFAPSKTFTFGVQALLGLEARWNADKAANIAAKNKRCGVAY